MNVLVTGGAGYIGSHTMVELLEAGRELVVVDNFVNSKPESLERVKKITGKDFKFYEVDLLDYDALDKVFEENDISFEHLPSGVDTMSVVLETKQIDEIRDRLLNRIQRMVRPDSISIEDGLALIAVVGRGMKNAKGTAAALFQSLAASDINIKMIDQGSSELNIIIGIDEADLKKAHVAIYNEFVK